MQKTHNQIICGDCIEVLGKTKNPFADLVFADPPFNIGSKYDKYYDKKKNQNYIAIGDDHAANVKIIADEIGLKLRNWLIWHYTFGQQTKNKFARAHTHIFYFVNDSKNFTFNDYAVRVPSDRQLVYNDKRANPAGKMPDDVWTEYSRVCGTFKERTGWHPCQMPENLLKRIIAVSSNPLDTVLDPFCGSGTTSAAAYQLNRNYVTIDISTQYVENARKRLANLKKQSPKNLFMDPSSISELERLLCDIRKTPREILNNKNFLEIVTNQLKVRTNNHKKYSSEQLATALKDLK
jgi:site-specific DNA-methyltransferase (adenine-specific)